MEQLTAEQFEEWKKYYDIEPWGFYEKDAQHSYTRKTFIDAMGAKTKSGKAPNMTDMSLQKLLDAKLKPNKKPQTQSVDEMKEILHTIARISKEQGKTRTRGNQ